MAKRKRFLLKLENGVEAGSLEELQENFSLECVDLYFRDGILETWLRDRYLDDMAVEIIYM